MATRSLLFLLLSLFINTNFSYAQSRRKVAKLINGSEVLKDHYTGFAMYKYGEDKPLFELNANKPAIPASNTKIFTLYTALKMLGDSIPGLKYIESGDSLIFWGTGDPSMLHPDLKSTRVPDFLKSSGKKLYYSMSNADWNFAASDIYDIALAAMPVGENTGRAYLENGKVVVKPNFLQASIRIDSTLKSTRYGLRRDEKTNTFRQPATTPPADFQQTLYLIPDTGLTRSFLEETLQKKVTIINRAQPANAKTIYSVPADSLYKRMMLPSDNYLAEQILYICSSTLPGKLSVQKTIDYSSKTFLNDLPDKFQWRDGSGLSRYSLFSPRSIIAVLKKLDEEIGNEQRLLNLFPVGGISGTLKNAYKTDNGVPFVWAKTGSLSNVHLQGGFFTTRKGKKYIYSFMNNNFLIPTSEIREEMGRIITHLHERY